MSNFLFTLPLKEIVIAQKGTKPSILHKEHLESTLPYLDIHALENEKAKQFTFRELGYIASKNDVLVVWDGSRCGLCFLGKEGVLGSTIMSLTPIEYDAEFLYYFLKSKFELLNGNTTGSSIPHVNPDLIYSLEIPFAPINLQKELVKEIKSKIANNSIFLLQQAKIVNETLSQNSISFHQDNNINTTINNFNNSILQYAVSGKLSNSNGKITIPKNITTKEKNHQIESWIIKDSWRFVKLKDVLKSFDYGTSNKSESTGLIPVLRMGNIQDNKILWENLKYTSDVKEIQKYKLNKGDVLFNRTNSPELVGKTAVYEGDVESVFAGYIIRLLPNEKLLNPNFLSFCLNSNYAKDFYTTIIIGSANQANISATRLGEFMIPLPSLEEQLEIVDKVQKLLEVSEIVKTNYQETLTVYNQLQMSIIENIFSFDNVIENQNISIRESTIQAIRTRKKELELTRKALVKSNARIKSSMKNAAISLPTLDIEEILPSNGKSMKANDVWKASKYKEDIDSFYEALKAKIDNTVECKITQLNSSEPLSNLSLKSEL